MSTIAFIGLGIMGSPMAINLQKAGHQVRGHTRTAVRAQPLVDAGGQAYDSVAEAVRGASVVCLMLPDGPDVEDVALGEAGVFATAAAGTLVIDFSTIRPGVARELSAQAAAAGLRMLDAPVSGGEAGARQGTLSIMVGGEPEDVSAAGEVFDVVGKTVAHLGPAGSGQTVKAANQLMVAGNIQVLAEALVFLEASGVQPEAALDVLAAGLAGSKALDAKRASMTGRSFDPGFRIELHHKDLGILTEAARDAGVALPMGGLLAQLMASAVASGDSQLDHAALLRGVLRLNGREA